MSEILPDRSKLLRAQAPAEFGEKIRSAAKGLSGERRHVTVLFADLAGFTSLSEQLDPEEVTEIINRCLTLLSQSIFAYEGTVDKFIGDAVMALFGAPVAHENDPERALRAALDMRRHLEEINRDMQANGRKPLALHIGINSGVVVAGGVGSDLRMDYTVMGDTVNLASRLESAAGLNQILVSETTYRLTRHAFEFGKPASFKVKGKAQPAIAYELLKPLPQPEMIRRTELGYHAMVGRNREVESLTELLDLVGKRQGQIVTVVGEAGVGKSRLVFELVKQAKERGFLVVQGHCESFEVAQAFQAFRLLLRTILNLNPDASTEETKKDLTAGLAALHPSLTDQAPFLGALLDLPDEQLGASKDSERQPRIQGALKLLLYRLAQTQKVLLVFDDLQWADELSRESLNYLVENIPSLPVLICGVYRPGFTQSWGTKSYYNQINLKPLASEQEKQLVQNLLPGAPPELVEFISARAEGNPFYIEEIVKSGLETGAIRREEQTYKLDKDVALPGSVHALIMARIDRLEESAKSLLQAAAVIGREFPVSILGQVAEKLDEIDRRLGELETMELIYEKQILPDLEYLFKHYLTQEVAYESILLKKRRQLHKQVARAIEEIYSDKLEQHFERLAYHYERAEDFKRAAEYFQKAAGKAREGYSDSVADRLVGKAEESVTKIYEERFKLSGPNWAVLLAAAALYSVMAGTFWWKASKIALTFQSAYGHWMLPKTDLIFGIFITLYPFYFPILIFLLRRPMSFLVHSRGLRVIKGKRTLNVDFSNLHAVRSARWWEAFSRFAQVPRLGMPFHQRGVLLSLFRKTRYSIWWGGGSRRVYIEPPDPGTFLKELNRAWNRWRLTQPEGKP